MNAGKGQNLEVKRRQNQTRGVFLFFTLEVGNFDIIEISINEEGGYRYTTASRLRIGLIEIKIRLSEISQTSRDTCSRCVSETFKSRDDIKKD